jgi:Ca2+-binding RTX toxin-like protein
LFADAVDSYDNARGGNDTLIAMGDANTLYGDANSMYDNARGGNDTLIAIGDENTLYGDAEFMSDNTRGGNDLLIGGLGNDLIVGDAATMSSTAQGGNDRLWGDPQGAAAGGADTFLFAGAIGRDIVFDFRPDEGDLLDLLTYGFNPDEGSTLADLDYSTAGGSTLIDIGTSFLGAAAGAHTIRLADHDDLSIDDFVAVVP